MKLILTCEDCRGPLKLDKKTRRRIIYKCTKCGREIAIRKQPKQQPQTQ